MEAAWFRPLGEGFLGHWHMRAGETTQGLVLAACDRTFRADEALDEDDVQVIPANERCYVCQGVRAANGAKRAGVARS